MKAQLYAILGVTTLASIGVLLAPPRGFNLSSLRGSMRSSKQTFKIFRTCIVSVLLWQPSGFLARPTMCYFESPENAQSAHFLFVSQHDGSPWVPWGLGSGTREAVNKHSHSEDLQNLSSQCLK